MKWVVTESICYSLLSHVFVSSSQYYESLYLLRALVICNYYYELWVMFLHTGSESIRT